MSHAKAEQLNAALRHRIKDCQSSARRFFPTITVDDDVAVRLHAIACRSDYRIRDVDDVRCRPVILDQIFRPRFVVFLECTNEIYGRTVEGIDVLVIIAHGKQAKAQVRIVH